MSVTTSAFCHIYRLNCKQDLSPSRVTGSIGRGSSSDVDVTDGTLCHLWEKRKYNKKEKHDFGDSLNHSPLQSHHCRPKGSLHYFSFTTVSVLVLAQ